MADTYSALLDALGFNASDAAQATGQTQRDLEMAKGSIELAGEDEREGLKASAESRGVLTSGEYMKDLARSRSDQASRLTAAESSAADRLSSIQRELERSKAQRQLQEEERNAQRQIADQQYSLSQQLLSQQAAELASQYSQPSVGGLDLETLYGWLFPEPDPQPQQSSKPKPSYGGWGYGGWWTR